MKPGFCYLAERADASVAIRRIITSFSRAGIGLINPYTGRITELAEDGQQVETTEAKLVQAAIDRAELSFQLWVSSDTHISCSFRHISPSIVGHAYPVDGLDATERNRLTRWAVDYFHEVVFDEAAALLVVDLAGVSKDVDWDDVVRQTTPLPAVLPAILGLPAAWMGQLGDHTGYSRERIADFELLRRRIAGL